MKAAVLLLALAGGCATNFPYQGDPAFTDKTIVFPVGTRPEILAGCRAWRVEGVHCATGPAPTVRVVEDWAGCDIAQTEGAATRFSDGTWELKFYLGCDFEHLEHTAAHEIGHTFGIGHIGEGNLMTHHRVLGADFVTIEDHEALIAAIR